MAKYRLNTTKYVLKGATKSGHIAFFFGGGVYPSLSQTLRFWDLYNFNWVKVYQMADETLLQ